MYLVLYINRCYNVYRCFVTANLCLTHFNSTCFQFSLFMVSFTRQLITHIQKSYFTKKKLELSSNVKHNLIHICIGNVLRCKVSSILLFNRLLHTKILNIHLKFEQFLGWLLYYQLIVVIIFIKFHRFQTKNRFYPDH